MLAPNRIS